MSISVRIILCLFALSICLLVAPRAVFACTCELPQPGKTLRQQVTEALGKSKAMFSGEVVNVVGEPKGFYVEVKFKVLTSWKQVRTNKISVRTGRGGGDCGYRFEVGESYLVYAYGSDESNLETNICQRTKKLANSREDLKLLGNGKTQRLAVGSAFEGFSQSAPISQECKVNGTVTDHPHDAAFSGAEVTLANESTSRVAQTDPRGKFGLLVSEGVYQVTVKVGMSDPNYKRARFRVSCDSKNILNIVLLPWCMSGCKPDKLKFVDLGPDWPRDKQLNAVITYSVKKSSKASIKYENATLTYGAYTLIAPTILQDNKTKTLLLEGPGCIKDANGRRAFIRLEVNFEADGLRINSR